MEKLFEKYFHGSLNDSERNELLRKVNSDESLKKQFMDFQNLNALSTLYPAVDDEHIGTADYIEFTRRHNHGKGRKIALKIAAYAASLALVIAATWAVTFSYTSNNKPSASQPLPPNTLYVPTGQRACLTLQDGTKVWLNARSTLTYPSVFSEKERCVNLIGEAFFEVSKDQKRPFIVSTKETNVKVLGTVFNIHSYPETDFVKTCLLEGSVVVSSTNSANSVQLAPNQQVIVKNGKMDVQDIKHLSYFLWKDGIYSFKNEPFKNIIKELEIYYDVKIIVTDPSLANFVYTGKFRQQDGVYEILRIVQKIHSFSIQKDEKTNTITISKMTKV